MPGQIPDRETARYRAQWDIVIDKRPFYEEKMEEAREIWDSVKIKNKSYDVRKQDCLIKQRKQQRLANGDNDKTEQNQMRLH